MEAKLILLWGLTPKRSTIVTAVHAKTFADKAEINWQIGN